MAEKVIEEQGERQMRNCKYIGQNIRGKIDEKYLKTESISLNWEQKYGGDWCFGFFLVCLTNYLAACPAHWLVCCTASLLWGSAGL